MPSDIEFAAVRRRGEKDFDDRQPLGFAHLVKVAIAAQQYRQAKSELIALREASVGERADRVRGLPALVRGRAPARSRGSLP